MAAGYKTNGGGVDELGSGVASWRAGDIAPFDQSALMQKSIRALLLAPYHAMRALSAATEVGMGSYHVGETLPASIGYIGTTPVKQPPTTVVIWQGYFLLGFGMDGRGQLPSSGAGVRTYPCEGSTEVNPKFDGEWTDPALGPGVTPGRALGAQPLGSTIMVVGDEYKTLALTGATVTRVSTGESVEIFALRTIANDPMAVYYPNSWTGYVMPDKPLLPNERYRVTVDGKNGDTPFTKAFTFTTGLQPVY